MSRLDEVLEPFREERMRLDLGPMRALLERLGNPERDVPAVLVAGTNGKGTVSALLAAILAASGVRAGLYTSPHLEEVRERIRIDGRALDDAELIDRIHRVATVAPVTPTYFELLTAVAFLAFRDVAAELAVLEVGLGGRLDATNTVDPVLAVITSIDRDHEAALGSKLADIAREKAGILRPGVPALLAESREPAFSVLEAAARDRGAPIVRPAAPPPGAGDRDRLEEIARRAAQVLRDGGVRVDPDLVPNAARDLRWPGRDEWVELPERRVVWLDVAHNPAATARLAARVAASGERWALLFGCLADKDAAAMLEALAPLAGDLYFVDPPDSPRALAAARLASLASRIRPQARVIAGPLAATLETALARERRLLVAGSFRVVGPVRQALRSRFGVPLPASEPLFGGSQSG